MKELGLPKNKLLASLPYKGTRKEVAEQVLGQNYYGRYLVDVAGDMIIAIKVMIAEGIEANNKELTKQLTQEFESLRPQ
jgi:hypothetical protein